MRRWWYGLSAAVVLAAALYVPVPFEVISPGLAAPVAGGDDSPAIVEVVPAADRITGALMLTAVSVARQPTIETLRAILDPNREVVGGITPPGVDEQRFTEIQRSLFQESVRVAAAVGLRAAGRQVTVRGGGARIEQVLPDTPAEGALEQGDVIVEAAGQRVQLASQLLAVMARQTSGDRVRLTVRRAGAEIRLQVRVRPLPGTNRPGLGVLVSTVRPTIELPVEVRPTEALPIGGESAGLMIALTVYDLTDPADLTAGRRIAGTGTIDLSGNVGEVSAIRAKVVAARRAGADVFLVPSSQAGEARQAADGALEVIGVGTLDEAIRRLGAG